MTAKQWVYAVTVLVGFVVTWYFNIQTFESNFIADMYANPASTSISNDLLVVVFTFLFWSFFEARKLGMKHWWAYLVFTFVIAAACTIPLFLLMRERKLLALEALNKSATNELTT